MLHRQINGLRLHGTDRQAHITYICAHTHRSPDRGISQRLVKGGVVCVCTWKDLGSIWGVLINCTDVDFLSQIRVSLNNLHMRYPPLAPPKPITGTHRRGPRPMLENVCGLTLHTHTHTHVHPLRHQPHHFIFPLEIHSDLNPDMGDRVQFPRRGAYCRSNH